MAAPVNPGTDSSMDWPAMGEIVSAQYESKEKPPKQFHSPTECFRNSSNGIWVTTYAEAPKLRIIIASHTGHGGHRRLNVTMATIREHFY